MDTFLCCASSPAEIFPHRLPPTPRQELSTRIGDGLLLLLSLGLGWFLMAVSLAGRLNVVRKTA